MQRKHPLISVVIDNYNYGRFLPQAIDSVLAQSFTDYEIIVVDDASTDDSHVVMQSYCNKITPIFQDKNSGQGAAFYAGFLASRGELISFLDADDLFLKEKLKRIAETAERYPDAVMIYHQGHTVNVNLDVLDQPFPARIKQGNLRKEVLRYSEVLFPPTSFLTFRRPFLQRVLPFPSFLARIDADYPLQVLAGVLGDIAGIPEVLSFYRVHGDNWFSNEDFLRLDLPMLLRLTRRTEKAFYLINQKLRELGIKEQLQPLKHRFHRRNLFIFKHINWWQYLSYTLTHPHFDSLKDRWEYIMFGVRRRREHLRQLSGAQ